jgi:uncharacterized protein YjbI with pentapeptide repeats
VNLTDANLSYANLTNAILRDANLNDAVLRDANLDGTILTGADLSDGRSGGITGTPDNLPTDWQLTGGYLIGPTANLTDANLSGANLDGTLFSGADLSDSILAWALNYNTAIWTGAFYYTDKEPFWDSGLTAAWLDSVGILAIDPNPIPEPTTLLLALVAAPLRVRCG